MVPPRPAKRRHGVSETSRPLFKNRHYFNTIR